MKILVINPGSTSTKVALFEDEKRITEKKIDHSREELGAFSSIAEELPMRIARVKGFLAENGTVPGGLDVIVARGGMLPPVRHGADVVDDNLVEASGTPRQYASNLGRGWRRRRARRRANRRSYDSISVDELTPLSRFPVSRVMTDGVSHILNTRHRKGRRGTGGFDLMSSMLLSPIWASISMNLQSNGDIIDIVRG